MAGKSKYLDVKEEIEARIASGEWPIGSQLPGEPDLVELFHYSRGTIRQALDEMAREGSISRRSGSGTYIMRRPSSVKAARFISLTAQIRAAGLVPSTEYRNPPRQLPASAAGERVCEAFGLESEKAEMTPLILIDRVRYGDARPLAWQRVYLLASDFGDNVLDSLNHQQSLYELYRQYRRVPTWADEVIEARAPHRFAASEDVDEVELLKIGEIPGQPNFVYARERMTYDAANTPLEYLRSVERSDFFRRYRYRIWGENP